MLSPHCPRLLNEWLVSLITWIFSMHMSPIMSRHRCIRWITNPKLHQSWLDQMRTFNYLVSEWCSFILFYFRVERRCRNIIFMSRFSCYLFANIVSYDLHSDLPSYDTSHVRDMRGSTMHPEWLRMWSWLVGCPLSKFISIKDLERSKSLILGSKLLLLLCYSPDVVQIPEQFYHLVDFKLVLAKMFMEMPYWIYTFKLQGLVKRKEWRRALLPEGK